jgi:hypothetical protein
MTAPLHNYDEAAIIAAVLAGDTQLYHELIRPMNAARISWRSRI